MDLTLALIAVLGAAGGTVGLARVVPALVRGRWQSWRTTWRGRAVEVVASATRKRLLVDGVRVAEKTTLSHTGATLVHTLEVEGAAHTITTMITYEAGALVARFYADGDWIGGSPPGGAVTPVGTPPLAAPSDPRWGAARILLAELRDSADPRLLEAANRIDRGLRDALGRLERFDSAKAAFTFLGGEEMQLAAAGARLDDQVAQLLEALRELHVIAAGGGAAPPFERIEELVTRVAADHEVDDVLDRAKKAASATRVRR